MGSFNCKQSAVVENVQHVASTAANVAVKHKEEIVDILADMNAPPALVIGTELAITGIECIEAIRNNAATTQ